MRCKTLTLLAVAASLGLAQAASAADMPVKAPVAVPVAYNWSGWYFGGDIGLQSSRIGLSDPNPGFPLTYSPRHSSVAFGGFAGYQRQFGQIVLGIEGGYTAATGSADLGATPSISIFSPGSFGTAQARLKDVWNIGGRAGWAMGNWMPYLTGGYANGSFRFDAQNTPGPRNETASAHAGGGYIGGGIDWMAWRNMVAGGDLILGVEYRHYAFSTKDTTGFDSAGANETVRFAPSTDMVVGRISLKFGN